MEIRAYTPADQDALYEICLRTGAAGGDATATSSHPRLLGDYFAIPYTVRDPELCLVLADADGPCGYILGTADTSSFAAWFNAEWLPQIRGRYRGLSPVAGATDAWLIERVQQDMRVPAAAGGFPAHLHIDLLPRTQGGGWGRRLFSAWTALAAARGATGVHLGVAAANTGAMRFYERMGMVRLEADDGAVLFGMRLPAPTPIQVETGFRIRAQNL